MSNNHDQDPSYFPRMRPHLKSVVVLPDLTLPIEGLRDVFAIDPHATLHLSAQGHSDHGRGAVVLDRTGILSGNPDPAITTEAEFDRRVHYVPSHLLVRLLSDVDGATEVLEKVHVYDPSREAVVVESQMDGEALSVKLRVSV